MKRRMMFSRQFMLSFVYLTGFALRCEAEDSIAMKKPYTLTPKPNYHYCTDPGDAVQLTDGIYSQGYFWTQKTTVGWNNVAPAYVTIDLGKVEPIRGVSWSCAAGVAGVTWPECLYVLVSDDKKAWTYLGDLCELGTVSRQPPEKGYAQFRYTTDTLRGRGRFVSIVAAAQPFCFVDEIEVWRGEDAWLQGELPGKRTGDLKAFYAESCVRSGMAGRMRADARTILAQAKALSPSVYESLKTTMVATESLIPICAEKADASLQTVLPYPASLHETILSLHARVLCAAGIKAPLVWKSNRWDPLELTALPPSGAGTSGIALDLMRGEVRGETFNLTNPGEGALFLMLTLERLPETANMELREVLTTDTKSRVPVATALRPLEYDARRNVFLMRVPGGCTRQVWVSCRRPACAAGTYRGELHVVSDDGQFGKRLTLKVRVRALDFPKQPALHVGGWDYVQGKADYYKAPGNVEANLALMRDLYVDSPWATAAVFPQGATFGGDGKLLNEEALDFSAWDAWVTRWHDARKFCVFFSVGESFNGEKMGTPRFTAMLGTWLRAWTRHMLKQGLKPDQLVILLVDEPHDRKQDAVIVTWAAAVRAADLGVALFEDPTYENPAKGDPAMFAACDVLCPNTPMMLAQGEPFRAFYRAQQAAGKTLWLYSCSGPAKLLDPITYHRAQAWLAFQMGAEGSFYWAFGCGGGIGDSWRAYAQAYSEYSPYFVGPDSVTESKHSEAIREGVQDYEYLHMLRDAVARVKPSGDADAWVARAEALLTDGVAEAVRAVTASNLLWQVEKDRSAMDAVRARALDLLETVNSRAPVKR
jgi:hypothetical protein